MALQDGSNFDHIFNKIYYDPSHVAGFSSAPKLLKAAKKENPRLKLIDAKEYLSRQDVYTKHKRTKYVFPRRKIVRMRVDEIWTADICYIIDGYERYNSGYRYLLTCIDSFRFISINITL